MNPLATFCLMFIGVYILISVICILVRKIKNPDNRTYYKFNVTDCNSNKTEFAVKAYNIREAMDTVRKLIEVICGDNCIEFSLPEEESRRCK